MKNPKITVFVFKGRVEAVYADTSLVDVKVVECSSGTYSEQFCREYDKSEAAGLEDIYFEKVVCDIPNGSFNE